MKRREFLNAGLASGAAALGLGALAPVVAARRKAVESAAASAGALKQSVCGGPYRNLRLDVLASAARDLGLKSVELLNPNEWPTVQKYGLTCAMANRPSGIPRSSTSSST